MKQHKILQLIYKDLGELQELTNELIESENRSQIEIEIALSKAKLISQEFELLKETSLKPSPKAQVEIAEPTPLKEVAPEPIQELNTIDESASEVIHTEEETTFSKEDSDEINKPLANSTNNETLRNNSKVEESPTSEIVTDVPEIKEEIQAANKNAQLNDIDHDSDIDEEEEQTIILGETFSKGKSLNDSINDNLTLDQKLASSPIEKLEPAIGLNDRFLFIRELFEGNSDHFLKAISNIDEMSNLKEAVNYLSTNHKWKKNEASLKFVELVKRRFQ